MRMRVTHPFAVLDRGLSKLAGFVWDREPILVERGHLDGGRSLWRWLVVRFVWLFSVLVAQIAMALTDGPVQNALSTYVTLSFSLAIGLCTFSGWNRARAYRRGWLDGRGRMVESLVERTADSPPRMSPETGRAFELWLEDASLYDAVHVSGMRVVTPDDPSGLS